MKITDTVAAICRDKIAELGFELYDVDYVKEDGSWVLILYIEGREPVTLDDCETVSRAVDPLLDEADPIEESYFLSVSSVGLDKPLKKDRDFERCMGEKLDIKLYAPLSGKKEYTGTLTAFDADSFTVAFDKGEPLTIARKSAALIRLHIDF